MAPDEDIWALAGDINEVEEQPSATGFDRFAAPVSATEVQAKISKEDCVPKSTRYKDKGGFPFSAKLQNVARSIFS